jgi:hypothetical protein
MQTCGNIQSDGLETVEFMQISGNSEVFILPRPTLHRVLLSRTAFGITLDQNFWQ